jgi:flavodoxin short chain
MPKVLVLYATLTGNNRIIAQLIFNQLRKAGKNVEIKNVTEMNPADIINYDVLVLGSSTYDMGLVEYQFRDFILNYKDIRPDLKGKKMAIFGCGESIYQFFCGAVDKLDHTFAMYGAQNIIDHLKIDGNPENNDNVNTIMDWTNKLSSLI